ncbi:MAG TPA: YggT family protein [Firmicutes bacterium]|nr:YggT family protein [Bacillota bacterium]
MGIILGFVVYALRALIWIVVFRVILEWLGVAYGTNPIQQLIYEISEFLIAPIRNIFPPLGMFDFSPVIVILILEIIIRLF